MKPLRKIERVILKSEMEKLVSGKEMIITYMRHKFKSYALMGYLKELKK